MGIDFKVLKKHVKQVIDELDHRNLNEMEAFAPKTFAPLTQKREFKMVLEGERFRWERR